MGSPELLEILAKGFIKNRRGVFIPLGQPGPCELPYQSILGVIPFKSKNLLALGGQGYTKEGIFQVQNRIIYMSWGQRA